MASIFTSGMVVSFVAISMVPTPNSRCQNGSIKVMSFTRYNSISSVRLLNTPCRMRSRCVVTS